MQQGGGVSCEKKFFTILHAGILLKKEFCLKKDDFRTKIFENFFFMIPPLLHKNAGQPAGRVRVIALTGGLDPTRSDPGHFPLNSS